MNQIKHLIREKGMEQKQISERIGISEQRISKLKRLNDKEYMYKVYGAELMLLDVLIKEQK
jgi:predicted XRE-type DNA-binding protein